MPKQRSLRLGAALVDAALIEDTHTRAEVDRALPYEMRRRYGRTELAHAFDVNPGTLGTWIHEGKFPEPDGIDHNTYPFWFYATMQDFLDTRESNKDKVRRATEKQRSASLRKAHAYRREMKQRPRTPVHQQPDSVYRGLDDLLSGDTWKPWHTED